MRTTFDPSIALFCLMKFRWLADAMCDDRNGSFRAAVVHLCSTTSYELSFYCASLTLCSNENGETSTGCVM